MCGGIVNKVGYKVVVRTDQRKYFTVSGNIRIHKNDITLRKSVDGKIWGPYTLFETLDRAKKYKTTLESKGKTNLEVVKVEYDESTSTNIWTHESGSGKKVHPAGTVFARWIKFIERV